MALILMNCSVQLRSQLMVSLPRQCYVVYQVLNAINSQLDSMNSKKDLSVLQLFYVTLEAERFIILLKTQIKKKIFDLSFFTNLADGILTVTLKGGMPQKYTGGKSLKMIFSKQL